VSIEFLLCLLFPIYITISRGGVWAGLLLIVAGFGGLLALIFTNTHGLDITFHNGALRGMSDFAIGVGMATVYGRIRARDGEPLPDYVHTIIQLIVVAALFYAIYHSGWSHQWRDIYLVPPMMALIFVLAFDRGWVASFFQSTPLQKLGEWSYAIYLGQTAWLQLIRFIQQRFYPPDDTIVMGYRWPDFIWWLEPISLVIVCLIWGALLSTFIEEPASKILRRWLDRAPKTRIGAP
jgi:peptidoglycan/LPS O-acetylase OafA/YrhL